MAAHVAVHVGCGRIAGRVADSCGWLSDVMQQAVQDLLPVHGLTFLHEGTGPGAGTWLG